MPLEAPVILRLEVESMKKQIATALNPVAMTQALEQNLDKVIANFDFEKAIAEATYQTVNQIIQDYFRYGKGKIAICEAVKESMDQVIQGLKEREEQKQLPY